MTKPKVAIITDSASDIPPDAAKKLGITIVPIIVTFGSESFKVNEELSMDQFWKRLTAPGAPFPKTAAPPPAAFTAAYDRAFAGGAERRQVLGDEGDRTGAAQVGAFDPGLGVAVHLVACDLAIGQGAGFVERVDIERAHFQRGIDDKGLHIVVDVADVQAHQGRHHRTVDASVLAVFIAHTVETGR